MPRWIVIGAIAVCTALLPAATARATVPAGFTETLIASGMPSPTAMALAPDGRIFVAQQGGALRVIKNGTLVATPFVTLSVDSTGERGLLGVAFDPAFDPQSAGDDYVYVYHTVPGTPPHNRVTRFTAVGDVAQGAGVPILDLENLGATNHNGGAIHFGPDGKLYVAVGDNAVGANAQLLTNRLGKILRINSDGTIPNDNPFANGIWARGFRNPFTFAFQPGTGRMFINDVGETTWEEFNDGIAGANYGWDIREGPCAKNSTTDCGPPPPGMTNPIHWYGHAGPPPTGCAIVGAAFYNPTTVQFPADYVGDYFFGDLCSGWIRRFDPVTNVAFDFASAISSLVDILVAKDGSLFYLARGGGGQLYRVTSGPPSAVLVRSLRAARTSRGVVVSWHATDPVRIAGFNVFRDRTRINRTLITADRRAAHSFTDRNAPRNRSLRYRLELRLLDGTRVWFGPVAVS